MKNGEFYIGFPDNMYILMSCLEPYKCPLDVFLENKRLSQKYIFRKNECRTLTFFLGVRNRRYIQGQTLSSASMSGESFCNVTNRLYVA